MKKIKNYEIFLESSQRELPRADFDIYDYYDMIREMSESDLKKWGKIFLGENLFQQILDLTENAFSKFKEIDLGLIKERLYHFEDDFDVTYEIFFALSYRRWYKYESDIFSKKQVTDESINGYYTGWDINNSSQLVIIKWIIIEIMRPCLFIQKGDIQDYEIRTTNSERYVTKDEFSCQNFNVEKLAIYSNPSLEEWKKKELSMLKNINIENILDVYRPTLMVEFKNMNGVYKPFKLSLRRMEEELDLYVEPILFDVDYRKIVFDYSRNSRKYEDMNITSYTLKVFL